MRCIKQFKTKYKTFEVGEEVFSSKINDTWYIIDAIGISKQDLKEYFV